MRKIFTLLVPAALLLLAPPAAVGQSAIDPGESEIGNTGNTLDPGSVGLHDLTRRPQGTTTMLYAPSEADDPAYRAAISGFLGGGTVDYFDARAGTPDASLLNNYDCIHTWANFSYDDNILFGDRLADRVDGGGSVVLGVFTTYTSGNFLDGRIMDPGYSPVVGGTNNFASSDYAGDGTTSIHDGVTAYECTFRDILTLQGGGLQDGSYLDGEIAHAYRPDFQVVYSNGSGSAALGCMGDWALLVANSCQASASGVPTTPSGGLLVLFVLLAVGGVTVIALRFRS